MRLPDWLKNLTGQKKQEIPAGSQGQFYYTIDYDNEYKELLAALPDRATALSELFLFRFWLTQYGYRLLKSKGTSEDDLLQDIISNGLTLGRGVFEHAHYVNIERTLGHSLAEVMEDRFKAYDHGVINMKDRDDPLGLLFSTVALANILFDDSSTQFDSYLIEKTNKQLLDIATLHIGDRDRAEKIIEAMTLLAAVKFPGQAKDNNDKEWLLVIEFGNSKTFVDTGSISISSHFVTANVIYVLDPYGTDKRNKRPVKEMQIREEYDLTNEKLRTHSISFTYDDGSTSGAMATGQNWMDVKDGHAKTLARLRHYINSTSST